MRLLLDANLATRLAPVVRDAGTDCHHISEFLAMTADDREVAALANRLEAALVTKDNDFRDLRMRSVLRMPLVWLRIGNMTSGRTQTFLLRALPAIQAAIARGNTIIEVR